MLPFKLIYGDGYDLNLGAHVFPSQKFRMIRDRLLEQKIADANDFLAPEPAADEDVLRVHSREYVRKLKTGTLSEAEIARLEIPYSRELVEACWLAAGGSILAGQWALRDGWAANIGGGFHHACPDHGEGFCAIHDVAVAIRHLQHDGAIERASADLDDTIRQLGELGLLGRPASQQTLGKLTTTLDDAHAARARLGDPGESNIIGPDEIDRLREPAKRARQSRRRSAAPIQPASFAARRAISVDPTPPPSR